MFLPGNSTDLLCLWPLHGCHRSLWPNSPAVPTCTEKSSLGAGLPSAIPPRLASATGGLNAPDLHLRGGHSQLKLLTLDVYCIFLKKKKKLVCELSVRFDIFLKHYLTD